MDVLIFSWFFVAEYTIAQVLKSGVFRPTDRPRLLPPVYESFAVNFEVPANF